MKTEEMMVILTTLEKMGDGVVVVAETGVETMSEGMVMMVEAHWCGNTGGRNGGGGEQEFQIRMEDSALDPSGLDPV